MPYYGEAPIERIVDVHWKKKDDGHEPPKPDPGNVCGFYERIGTAETNVEPGISLTFVNPEGRTLSFGNYAELRAYEAEFYAKYDPPGYTGGHDLPGVFFLDSGGLSWNSPTQPINAQNVPGKNVIGAQIDIEGTGDGTPIDRGPDSYGHWLTWTNFFDLSTWYWVPNIPVPIWTYTGMTFGLAYSSMTFASGPEKMPPVPTSMFVVGGTTSPVYTSYAISYYYDIKANKPKLHDPSGGGPGAFYQAGDNGSANTDPRWPGPLPFGEIWYDNRPVNIRMSNRFKITLFCAPEPPPGGSSATNVFDLSTRDHQTVVDVEDFRAASMPTTEQSTQYLVTDLLNPFPPNIFQVPR